MPTKPDKETLDAANTMKNDPDFAKSVLTAIINETPQLRDALVREGLVKEV